MCFCYTWNAERRRISSNSRTAMRQFSPTNAPDPSFHGKETQAVREPWYPPASPAWGPALQGTLGNTSALQPLCEGSEYLKNTLCGNSCFTPRLFFFLQDILQEDQLPWVTSAVFGYHLLAKAGLSLKSASISVKGSFMQIKKPEFEGRWMGKQSLERTPATMQQCCFSVQERVTSSAGSSQHQNHRGHLLLGQTSLKR